eukprot:4283756-Amphidinium_carterae.1
MGHYGMVRHEVLTRRSIGEMFASGAIAMYLACDAAFAEKDADFRSQAGYTVFWPVEPWWIRFRGLREVCTGSLAFTDHQESGA